MIADGLSGMGDEAGVVRASVSSTKRRVLASEVDWLTPRIRLYGPLPAKAMAPETSIETVAAVVSEKARDTRITMIPLTRPMPELLIERTTSENGDTPWSAYERIGRELVGRLGTPIAGTLWQRGNTAPLPIPPGLPRVSASGTEEDRREWNAYERMGRSLLGGRTSSTDDSTALSGTPATLPGAATHFELSTSQEFPSGNLDASGVDDDDFQLATIREESEPNSGLEADVEADLAELDASIRLADQRIANLLQEENDALEHLKNTGVEDEQGLVLELAGMI